MQHYRIIVLLLIFNLFSCNSNNNQAAFFMGEFETLPPVPPLPEKTIQKIDSTLTKMVSQFHFNGSILVALKGYPLFRISTGYADIFTKQPLDFNTSFQIASVSKSFAAMSVLMLKEKGVLDLTDPVKKHIPEFPFENVTIRHLLQHTSGLPNYMYFIDQYWRPDSTITNQQVLQLLIDKNAQLTFTPGQRHIYSNTGYAMLALLVERVSGMPYYKFLHKNIFEPLEMDHTFAWNRTEIDSNKNIAVGFHRYGWKFRKIAPDVLDQVVGDKSIYSTVDDLFKYDQALYKGILISDSLLNDAFTMAVVRNNRPVKYGYGWRLKEVEGKKVIYHNGLWNGFTASLTRYVEDNITIIVTSNTNAPAGNIVEQIYGVLSLELFGKQAVDDDN
jgi:CubicO group peptidase (beta-lactamase class C family)